MFKHTHPYTPTLGEIVVENGNAETTAIVVDTSTMQLVCDACPGVALNLFMELLRVHTRTHAHTNILIHMCIQIYTHVHICIYIYIYICVHIHIYMCTLVHATIQNVEGNTKNTAYVHAQI